MNKEQTSPCAVCQKPVKLIAPKFGRQLTYCQEHIKDATKILADLFNLK